MNNSMINNMSYRVFSNKKNSRGFTLAELLVAMTILAFTISALLLAFVNCQLLNESNNNLAIATNDAQYVLEEIKCTGYSNINNFINNFDPLYFENLNVETITFPNLVVGADITEVTVEVGWIERGRNKHVSLSTQFSR